MKTLVLLMGLLASGLASAQYSQQPQSGGVNYNYLELRYVDVDANGGSGLQLGGSIDVGDNFLLLGSITTLEFDNNVDANLFQIGGGYIWHYSNDFDFLAMVQYVNVDVDGSDGDNGVRFSGGTRGLIAPQFEVRGFVHYTTAGDGDTWLEIAGDYHFNQKFAAGVSIEFGGDTDVFTIGGRFFFR
jgi:hypothetical protein